MKRTTRPFWLAMLWVPATIILFGFWVSLSIEDHQFSMMATMVIYAAIIFGITLLLAYPAFRLSRAIGLTALPTAVIIGVAVVAVCVLVELASESLLVWSFTVLATSGERGDWGSIHLNVREFVGPGVLGLLVATSFWWFERAVPERA